MYFSSPGKSLCAKTNTICKFRKFGIEWAIYRALWIFDFSLIHNVFYYTHELTQFGMKYTMNLFCIIMYYMQHVLYYGLSYTQKGTNTASFRLNRTHNVN